MEFCSEVCAERFSAWSERQLIWDAEHHVLPDSAEPHLDDAPESDPERDGDG